MSGDAIHPTGRTWGLALRSPWAWLALAAAAAAVIGTGQRIGFDIPSAAEAKAVVPVADDLSDGAKRDLLDVTSGVRAVDQAEGVEAAKINAALPFSGAPVEAAAPLSLAAAAANDRARAERCLTEAIYHEAGFEPLEGRRAVAQVVLNRLRHPAFPKSVCGVVYQGSSAPGCQFSFTCDGALRRAPAPSAWSQAAAIARDALAGRVTASVGVATHYHASYVAPYWAPKLGKIAQIGTHIFYRWPGAWGRKRAFTGRYAGGEAAGLPMLADASTAAEGETVPAALAPDERRAPNDIGGRLDVTRGWKLSIPDPKDSGGSLAKARDAQQKTDLAAVSRSDGSRAQ